MAKEPLVLHKKSYVKSMQKISNPKSQRLFCDSQLVFDKLVQNKVVGANVRVFTRSFVLAENWEVDTVYLDGKLSTEERQKFKLGIKPVEKKIGAKLKNAEYTSAQNFIFLQLFNDFQNDILDAILLGSDGEFNGESIIAIPKTRRQEIDEVLRPNWDKWLAGDQHISLVDVDVPYHNERAPRGDINARLIDRLKLGGYQSILWKLAQKNWLPGLFCNAGQVGIVGQTELLRDAVAHCVLDRHIPVFIEKPKVNTARSAEDFELATQIINEVIDVVDERLSLIPANSLRQKARELLTERTARAFRDYSHLCKQWEKILKANPDLKCILSGFSSGPTAMAMADSCKRADIKIAAFQHGITRELLAMAEERSIFYETCFSDVFFTMNEMSKKVTNENDQNKKSKIISSNWPSTFKRISKSRKKSGASFLFVSTNLYSGHRPNGVPPLNDQDLFTLEMGLVENVFSKVTNIINYKPYPAIRQLDKDPVINAVNAKVNMNVIGAHEELRYLMESYRLFITSRATSTVSWLVASGKPLVFIDHYCQARLSDSAKQAFSEAFFLFDQSKDNFAHELRNFLNRPFSEIEYEWDMKSSARCKVIKAFFNGKVADCQNKFFNDIREFCLNKTTEKTLV